MPPPPPLSPPPGRVPAGNNGIVGIKPSVGRFSTTGVSCRCKLHKSSLETLPPVADRTHARLQPAC